MKAYDKGVRAANAGKTEGYNPYREYINCRSVFGWSYTRTNDAHYQWRRGFADGMRAQPEPVTPEEVKQ